MNFSGLLHKHQIPIVCGFTAFVILSASSAVVAQSAAKVQKYQKIAVINHGGFVMNAKPSWTCKGASGAKSGSLDASRKFPVGENASWDMKDASGITTGCDMSVGIGVVWGKDITTPTIQYAPNGHTATFEVGGVTWDPWVKLH